MFIYKDYQLPSHKEIRCVLRVISTVGWYKASFILARVGLAFPFFINSLGRYYWKIIVFLLSRLCCNTTYLKRYIKDNILLLVRLNTYRGLRHKYFLPVRGQRTRTNAGTQRHFREKLGDKVWEKLI